MNANIGTYRALWSGYYPPSPNSFSWSLTAPSVALYAKGDYSTIQSNVALTGAGVFNVGANFHGVYSGVLSGAFAMTVQGGTIAKNGYLLLTNNNTYSGGTTIKAGANVVVGRGGAANTGLGSGAISIQAGGSLTYNFNSYANTISNAISGGGVLNLVGDGVVVANSNGGYALSNLTGFTGNINLNFARIAISGAQGTAPITVSAGSSVYIAGGTCSNPINLGSNGWDTLTNEALRIDNGSTLAGAVNVKTNSTIGSYSGGGTISGALSGSSTLTINQGGGVSLTLSNASNSANLSYICNSGITVFSAGAFLTGITGQSVTINSGATATLNGLSNTAYPVRSATVFNVNNGGTLAFVGANTKDGCCYLSTLNLTNSGSAATVSSSDGSGFRGGYNVNTTITSSGTVANNISCGIWLVNGNWYTFTINNSNALNISGIITDFATLGGMPIIKNGAGNLTLSAANNYTGGVTLNAGTLTLTNTNTSGAVVASGAAISGGTVTTGTMGALTFSAVGATLTANAITTTSISKLTATSITAASGFTVNLLGTMNAGTYTLLSCTATLPSTLPTIGTNTTGRTPTFAWVAGTGLQVTLV